MTNRVARRLRGLSRASPKAELSVFFSYKPEANQFRVFLHSAAYVLMHTLKTTILRHTPFAHTTFDTIRLRLFKIGTRVRELKTKIKIELPSSYPLKDIMKQSFEIFACLRRT